ncbi:HTH-type transcriptional activator Btr [Planctomycetes bacterium MalM25]|nr:HTH-type transcriptional activator Btr [Planctomycetes bacterium MalM25]
MKPQNPQPDFFSQSVREARRFFLDLAPSPDVDLAVVCGGYEDCQADYAIRRVSFPYCSIELVTRGKGLVTLGAEQHELGPGSLFTYGAGVPHRISTDRDTRLGKYFVNFAGSGALSLLTQIAAPPGTCLRISSVPEVQLLFNELIRDGVRGDESSQAICAAMLRCLALRAAAHRSTGDGTGPEPYETYQRCVNHLVANAQRLTSQQQAAAECGVSPEYLSRLFKRHGRQSPYQMLLRLRMNLAAERLLDSDDTIKQVAQDLSYTDPFHFSRTFKATFGVSPSEFRKLR